MPSRRKVAHVVVAALLVGGLVGVQQVSAVIRPLPSGTGYEALTVKLPDCAVPTSDSYCTPPSNAIFVSTSGSDTSGTGSAASPYRSVKKGISAAAAGSTVVIRGGTYREGGFKFFKRLNLQSFPGEQVWIKGSSAVAPAEWVSDNGQWRKDGYNPAICRPKLEDATSGTGCTITEFAPDVGMSQWPDMAFINGVPQEQVGSRAEATAGKFYVDAVGQKLYLGSDPSAKTVEVADQAMGMVLYGPYTDGTSVRGIGFAHFANVQNYSSEASATVIANAANLTFTNNVFAFSASAGMQVGGVNAKITNNTFIYNGFNGLNGNRAHDAVVINNRVAHNNREVFVDPQGAGSAEAGSKWTHSNRVLVKDNLYEHNSKGFWCDLECVDWTFVGNHFRNNRGAGVFYEVSKSARIYSNIFEGNGGNGLQAMGEDIAVYNNTFVDNQQAIAVWEDARTPGTVTDPFGKAIYANTRSVRIKNNILSGFNSKASESIFGRPVKLVDVDGLGEADSVLPGVMVTELNYNLYNRPVLKPVNAIGWAGGCANVTTSPTKCTRAVNALYDVAPSSRLLAETGREGNGLAYNNATPDLFVNKAAGDLRLSETSVARGRGEALPADVAAVIGVPAGTPVAMGALKVRGSDMVGVGTGTSTTTTALPTTTTTVPVAPTTTQLSATTTITAAPATTAAPPTTVLPAPMPSIRTSNGLAVDVSGGSLRDGAAVVQYGAHGGLSQQWKVSAVPGVAGYYTLVNANSGKCLEVGAGGRKNPGPVRQWSCNGTRAQMWKLNPAAQTGIVNRSTGLALDVPNNSTSQGLALQQRPYKGVAGQLFRIA